MIMKLSTVASLDPRLTTKLHIGSQIDNYSMTCYPHNSKESVSSVNRIGMHFRSFQRDLHWNP